MTVIAWREGFMSADSLVTGNGVVFAYSTKIFRNKKGWVGGSCGDLSGLTEIKEWIDGGCKNKLSFSGDNEAIVVSPKGVVYFIDEHDKMIELKQEFVAIGSGWNVALGALEMGADAKKAVEVACKHVTTCGGLITTIETAHRRVRSATLGK